MARRRKDQDLPIGLRWRSLTHTRSIYALFTLPNGRVIERNCHTDNPHRAHRRYHELHRQFFTAFYAGTLDKLVKPRPKKAPAQPPAEAANETLAKSETNRCTS